MWSKISILISVIAIAWGAIGMRLPHCDEGGIHMICVGHRHTSANHEKKHHQNHGACVREIAMIADKAFKSCVCPTPAILSADVCYLCLPVVGEDVIRPDVEEIYGFESFREIDSRGPPAGMEIVFQ